MRITEPVNDRCHPQMELSVGQFTRSQCQQLQRLHRVERVTRPLLREVAISAPQDSYERLDDREPLPAIETRWCGPLPRRPLRRKKLIQRLAALGYVQNSTAPVSGS